MNVDDGYIHDNQVASGDLRHNYVEMTTTTLRRLRYYY